jgi:hypothetical protein
LRGNLIKKMDAGTRRARIRKMCQTCDQETAQAGSAARSQKSMDDEDESEDTSENRRREKGAGCIEEGD